MANSPDPRSRSTSPAASGNPSHFDSTFHTSQSRELSYVTLHFLQEELVKYICDSHMTQFRRNGGKERTTTSAVKTVTTEASSSATQFSAAVENRDLCITLLEELGFNIGIRLSERLTLTRTRIWDQRECVKFICKDLWGILFQKQADRLQTNRKGGYVIIDNNLLSLRHLAPSSPIINENNAEFRIAQLPSTRLVHVCGVIRGALSNLGFPCVVIAEAPNPPACAFQIRMS